MMESGSHVRSMELVASGVADVAAIDCVSYALAERYRPDLVQPLRTIARSPFVSGLPYVTAAGRSRTEILRLRHALSEAIEDPRLAEVRAALLITGVEMLARGLSRHLVYRSSGGWGDGSRNIILMQDTMRSTQAHDRLDVI